MEPDTATTPIHPTTIAPSSPIAPNLPSPSLPDPTTLGLSNARSYALQTILLNEDIPAFLTTFNLPILSRLPDRLDIPRGVSYPNWLHRMLKDPHESIPPSILKTPVAMPIGDIYSGQKLDECFKGSIPTIRLEPSGTYPDTAGTIRAFLKGVGVTGDLLYRGTSRHEARCALEEFKPAPIECTDLGKGLYTSRQIQLALGYSGPTGVVWVFKHQGYSTLVRVALRGHGWEYVASGLSHVTGDSDVVVGAVSEDRGAAGMQGCEKIKGPRVQVLEGGWQWVCWRTKKGRDLLAAGLVAMVFLGTDGG